MPYPFFFVNQRLREFCVAVVPAHCYECVVLLHAGHDGPPTGSTHLAEI